MKTLPALPKQVMCTNMLLIHTRQIELLCYGKYFSGAYVFISQTGMELRTRMRVSGENASIVLKLDAAIYFRL